jgi:hypothetical protein
MIPDMLCVGHIPHQLASDVELQELRFQANRRVGLQIHVRSFDRSQERKIGRSY